MISIRRTSDSMGHSVREWNTRCDVKSIKSVNALATAYKIFAQALCPVDTGRLQNSIGNPSKEGIWEISEKGLHIKVGTKVPYAVYVEYGVNQPYTISAKPGKVLHFFYNGKEFFVKSVRHPAMRGTFFMKNAAAEVRRNSSSIIRAVI